MATFLRGLAIIWATSLGLIFIFAIASFLYDAIYTKAWRSGFNEARRLYTWVEDHVPDDLDERKPR